MPRCKGKLDNDTLCPVKNAKFGLPGGKAEYCKPCSINGLPWYIPLIIF